MMYCDRCNIDFSEGLRYCKWCGQTLVERRRDTSELKTCPACSAAIQPAWTFCKACGTQLVGSGSLEGTISSTCPRCGTATDPTSLNCLRCGLDLREGREWGRITNSDATPTAAIGPCPSCGEAVDPNSIYCKACGSALYTQTPSTPSSLLCSVCKSFSPVGSSTCRICGALLIETEVDLSKRTSESPSINQQKSSTLPDLPDHLPETEKVKRRTDPYGLSSEESSEVESGAHTLMFTDSDAQPVKPVEERPTILPGGVDLSKSKATNVLPGVAGSQFEQPSPTAVFNQTRITGPVDSESTEDAPPSNSSGELDAALANQPPQLTLAPYPTDEAGESSLPQGTSVLGSDADLRDTGAALSSHKTVVFGSDAEGEDDSIEPQWDEEPPRVRQEVMTAPFALTPPHLEQEQAGATQAISDMTQDLDSIKAQEMSQQATPAEPSLRPTTERAVATSDEPAATVQPITEKKKSNAAFLSVAALIAVAAIGFIVWWLMSGGEKSQQAQEPPVAQNQPAPAPATQPPAPESAPAKPPAPAAPEGMVMVEAGAHIIGRDDADPVERPQRTINLPAYFIDRTEVTNADYKKFVDATGHEPPQNWKGGSYPEGKANYPVTSVTWQDASDYANWAGKRLPTEAEWEAAARGVDGRIYPWGNEWRPALGNIGQKAKDIKASEYADDLKQVGQYSEGASPAGALDMIGNVWEWTADEFALYEGGPKEIPKHIKDRIDPSKTYRVIRGGAFDGSKIHDASYRGLLDASERYPKVGFRCVKDASTSRQ